MTSDATTLAASPAGTPHTGSPHTGSAHTGTVHAETKEIPVWLILLMATALGLVVANLYYAQPLIGPISRALSMSPETAGLIITMAQVGYGTGLLLIVPLADMVENRRLIVTLVLAAAVALACMALSRQALPFLAAALAVGLSCVAAQVIVPFAAHLSPEASRGRTVGNVMSGLLLGIMLARPVSSFVTAASSWPVIFGISSVLMIGVAVVLRVALPPRRPAPGLSYGSLLASMATLMRTTPLLRRRGLYQAAMFGMFSLYWTTSPLRLAGPEFHMSQIGIALVALAGVAGAIAAPIAGRLADAGWERPATGFGLILAIMSFLITHLGAYGSTASLVLLVAAAILLDFGVTTTLVVSQRSLYSLGAGIRNRINGLFMATFFIGGALGSAVGAWAFAKGGWEATSWIGAVVPALAFLFYLTEYRRAR